MQYYYNINTDYIGELPERVVTATGTRTDPTTYTDEELEEWGYVLLPAQPEVAIDEFIYFDKETRNWVVAKKPLEPQWDEIRKQRNKLLADTDWYVIRFIERGVEVPPDVSTYRKLLRDITLQENPFFIEWPTIDINN